MEDEDSIASLLDFEVWFVPRSGGVESAHAHASAIHPRGSEGEGEQLLQQSTEGAQPCTNEEAPPSGRQARDKQHGGRAISGGRSSSAGRQSASMNRSDAEEEGEGPAKRARVEEKEEEEEEEEEEESDTPAAQQGPTMPAGTVVVPTSKFALRTRSRVLRSFLADKNQTTFKVPYNNHEHLEAGKLVVQLLQDIAMPPELKTLDWDVTPPSPNLVVQMCRWAIFWDAPSATELCLDRLSRCELEVLSAADISGILDLPNAIHTMPQYAKAKERCVAWLLRSFSDVPAIIADDGLRASFCSELSFAAVVLWAAQDGLTVRSENEVAVLLSFWYEAQDSVSEEEEQELSGVVRVGRMSKSFRHFILPKLAWFMPPVSLATSNMAFDEGSTESAIELCSDPLPSAWVASTRKPWVGSAELTFVFQKADLEGLLADAAAEGEAEAKSIDLPYFGFFFCLQLVLDSEGTLSFFLLPCTQHPIPMPKAVFVSFFFELIEADGLGDSAQDYFSIWLPGGLGWGGTPAAFDNVKLKSIEDISRLFGESLQIKVKFLDVK